MMQRVFVDANVLYSRTLRDWTFLFRGSTDGMFQLHSTEDVFAEVHKRLFAVEGAETGPSGLGVAVSG